MSKYSVKSQMNWGRKVFWITNDDTLMIEKAPSKYLKHKINQHRSPNTVRSMALAISYYMSFLDENELTLEDVFAMSYEDQFEHFADYLRWLKMGKHTEKKHIPKNNTCNSYLATVFNYLMFTAYDNEMNAQLKVLSRKEVSYVDSVGVRIKRMVMHFDGYLPSEDHKSRAMDRDNLMKLIRSCKCLRDKLLLLMIAETGQRIGEVLGVNYVKDIDYDNMSVRVEVRENNENNARAKYAEYRTLYFSERTSELLNAYISENSALLADTEYLFINLHGPNKGKAMTVNAVYSMLKLLENRTGIKSTPHMLRHYFVTERRKSGWETLEISTVLGHKSIRTTEAYLGVAEEELEEATEKFFEHNGNLYDIRKLL